MSCGTEGRCRTIRRISDTLALHLPQPVVLSRAEAWRRADAQFNSTNTTNNLIGIREIPDAYVTWAVQPPQEEITAETSVIVVDKHTGLLTVWPALPITTLAEQYRRYVTGKPLTWQDGDEQ